MKGIFLCLALKKQEGATSWYVFSRSRWYSVYEVVAVYDGMDGFGLVSRGVCAQEGDSSDLGAGCAVEEY